MWGGCAGQYADLIAVDADPLSDVRALEKAGFVMKGGAIIKDDLTAAGKPATQPAAGR